MARPWRNTLPASGCSTEAVGRYGLTGPRGNPGLTTKPFGQRTVPREVWARIVLHKKERVRSHAKREGNKQSRALVRCGAFDYLVTMTQAVVQILNEVERLSPREQVELRQKICERVPMSEDLTDDDFAALAAASFRDLDDEEARRA